MAGRRGKSRGLQPASLGSKGNGPLPVEHAALGNSFVNARVREPVPASQRPIRESWMAIHGVEVLVGKCNKMRRAAMRLLEPTVAHTVPDV